MAATVVTYRANGNQIDFGITFDYLAKRFVTVSKDGTKVTHGTDYTFENSRTIRFNVAPVAGTVVTIRRETSATDRIVTFKDASVLKATDLDVSALQTFHIAEEAKDFLVDTISINLDGDFDARIHKIVNVVDPTNPQDAATKNYIDTLSNNVHDSIKEAQRYANESKQSSIESAASATEAKEQVPLAQAEVQKAKDEVVKAQAEVAKAVTAADESKAQVALAAQEVAKAAAEVQKAKDVVTTAKQEVVAEGAAQVQLAKDEVVKAKAEADRSAAQVALAKAEADRAAAQVDLAAQEAAKGKQFSVSAAASASTALVASRDVITTKGQVEVLKTETDGLVVQARNYANEATISAATAKAQADRAQQLANSFDTVGIGNRITAVEGRITSAEVKADNATAAANAATAAADLATSTANAVDAKASSALSTANAASSKADTATTTANAVDTKATNALNTANSAQSTANTANTNATNALNAANTATTKANNAQTSANTAQATANGALAKTGGVMTGSIYLKGDATTPLEPVTKRQFDSFSPTLPTDVARTGNNNVFTKAQSGKITVLNTTSSPIPINMADSNHFKLNLTQDSVLDNPTNAAEGQSGIIIIRHSAANVTMGYNENYIFAGGTPPSLSSTFGSSDYLTYFVETPSRIFVSSIKDIK